MIVATERGRDALGIRPHDTRRYNLPMQPQFTTPPLFGDPRLPARFWAKVLAAPSGCWVWCAATQDRMGYGLFWAGEGAALAHRVAYEVLVGSVPEGLQIDHLCRNSPCVNVVHMELVTSRENTLRGNSPPARNARVVRCPRGHLYDAENTRWRKDGRGRECKACLDEVNAVRHQKVGM